MVCDWFPQTSLNARHCLIFEVITAVVDTTAKYSLLQCGFCITQKRSFKTFKKTHLKKTLSLPLTFPNSSQIPLWCILYVSKSNNYIHFYDRNKRIRVLLHFLLTAQEPGKGNWSYKWRLTTLDLWLTKLQTCLSLHFISIQAIFLPCTYNLLHGSRVHYLLFFPMYFKRFGDRKLFQVFFGTRHKI